MDVLPATNVLVRQPAHQNFHEDVLKGLSQSPKRLPCKYFYDRRGSMLFDAICAQPEYYLTRVEQQIMGEHSAAMAARIRPGAMLIEFGSGSSIKTRHLLQHLPRPAAYVPVDISREHLVTTAAGLANRYPDIEIHPVCADFTAPFALPATRLTEVRRVVYFPGSTIGNFEPAAARRLLQRIARLGGPRGGLLVGIDLVKDRHVIERAYTDAAGVTAEFNLNLLLRINRELGGEFDLDEFEHYAFYDPHHQRMDIRLVSKDNQQVRVNGATFDFQKGESIHTEYSHKYTLEGFAEMARATGLALRDVWTDGNEYFGVLYFECDNAA